MEYDINRFKQVVDNIFDSFEASSRKEETKNLFNSRTLDLPVNSEEDAIDKALEELEKIRLAFIKFQDEVRDTMMFNYITSPIEQFAKYASDLTEVIEDTIDESQLTPDTLRKYKSLKKLRAQILSNVYNKYKKKD